MPLLLDDPYIAEMLPWSRVVAIWWWIGRQYASRTEAES